MSSFSTALSGLAANNAALDVVGNNLANVNTDGFKASSAEFKDVMGQVTGTAQIGSGVSPAYTSRQFNQGSIQQTGGAFDAAIQGNGFFVVKGSGGETLYTRDGGFKVDGSGMLITATGERVQGWAATGGVATTSGPVSDLSVKTLASQAPSATTQMTLSANLDANAAVDDTFSTPIQIVDSLGATHVVTVTFTKTGAGAWDYEVTIPGEELTSGTAGEPSSLATGSLEFDNTGALTSPDATSPVTLDIPGLENGGADISIEWSFFKGETPLMTQYAQTSAASGTTQNGVQAAEVTGVSIGDGGTLIASYSSGARLVVAQLALASVGNPDSLLSVGNNNFQIGADTMTPSVGGPGTATRGKIVGGAREASNVDLARELTNLILYQRGYQANSKVITTIDQVTQVLLNMK